LNCFTHGEGRWVFPDTHSGGQGQKERWETGDRGFLDFSALHLGEVMNSSKETGGGHDLHQRTLEVLKREN